MQTFEDKLDPVIEGMIRVWFAHLKAESEYPLRKFLTLEDGGDDANL